MKTTTVFTFFLLFLVVVGSAHAALRTFTAQETDVVKLEPIAVDPDNDAVTFSYSEPFNASGEWQTGYDDAGEYTVTITASDGQGNTVEDVKVIIKEKNRLPLLTTPTVTVKEDETVDFTKLFSDPDGDKLTFIFSEPVQKSGLWRTTYDDAGEYTITFKVKDKEQETTHSVKVIVEQKNQPPTIADIFLTTDKTVEVKEGETKEFFVVAQDNDADKVTYQWLLNDEVIGKRAKINRFFSYDDAGEHILKLIISDGKDTVTREWTLVVANTNRPPTFSLLPIRVAEGEVLDIKVPETDADGDLISYTFSKPLSKDGVWHIHYDAAGEYTITVTADDGKLTHKETLQLTVVDTDRAPELQLPSQLAIAEGNTLTHKIVTSDPDDDQITISVTGLPSGANFDQQTRTLSWTPTYQTLMRRGGLLSNVLNALRLEHDFIGKREIPISVESCGKDKCTTKKSILLVYDSNRAPQLSTPTSLTIQETQEFVVPQNVVDPDGDIVKLYFTDPLGKRSGTWQTTYDDAGNYTATITASDGSATDTKPIQLIVTNKNRLPTIDADRNTILAQEGEEFTITLLTTDPDNEPLGISVAEPPKGSTLEANTFTWTPSYNSVVNAQKGTKNNIYSTFSWTNKRFNSDRAVVPLVFSVNDGEDTATTTVNVQIANVNLPPTAENITSQVTAQVGVPTQFSVIAQDPDNDDLTYTWSFGPGEKKVSGAPTVERTFTSLGQKQVSVVVSDGHKSLRRTWSVNVVGYVYPTEPVYEEHVYNAWIIER